jgi:predicted Fe-Mo cluster-binding NifX family protein
MKEEMVAMPVYQERISPLLDVARKFAIYELQNGEIKQKVFVDVGAESEPLRVEKLKEIGVSVIISGAVSDLVSQMVSEKGIRLISWVNGPADDVIDSYVKGVLESSRLKTSVCGNKRRQGHGTCAGKNHGRKGRNNNGEDVK